MAGSEAHSHCQSGHVCGYVIASSNQMPVFNATHKRMHRLEKIKYIKDTVVSNYNEPLALLESGNYIMADQGFNLDIQGSHTRKPTLGKGVDNC